VRRVGALRRRRLLPRASVEHGQAPLDASGSTGTTQKRVVKIPLPLDSLGGELYRACRSHIQSASHVNDSGDLFLRLTPRAELYKNFRPVPIRVNPYTFTSFSCAIRGPTLLTSATTGTITIAQNHNVVADSGNTSPFRKEPAIGYQNGITG
jgi:hypothetical protein